MGSSSPDVVDDFLRSHSSIPDEGAFSTGTVFGEWRITAFVAKGGNGEVYRVEHRATGLIGALKVLVATSGATKRERFLREAKLLGQLKGSHFPRLLATGEVEGYPYFVIEFLEPVELPKTDRTIARYLLEVCEAVGAVHRLGYAHRDLKPQNILRRENGTLVLIDYGLVKEITPAPSTKDDSLSIVDGRHVGVGTPKYAASEQFAGGEITPATDIHALGVLAEKLLERGGGVVADASWKSIIRRATSSIVSERYQSVDDFAAAIRRLGFWRHIAICLSGIVLVVGTLWMMHAVVVSFFIPPLPEVLDLKGQTIVKSKPLVLKAGKTYRVVGPWTLDADISGEKGARLWMTNCMVLNRAKTIFPSVPLQYELTAGVYLNFINTDKPDGEYRLREFIPMYDGGFNDVRYRGPDTISGLIQLKNSEYFELLKKDL